MNGRMLFSAGILLAAIVAIVVAVGPDLGGDDDDSMPAAAVTTPPAAPGPVSTPTAPKEPGRPAAKPLPADPDDLPGTDERSLIRPRNLQRALRVLERERVRREGVFDGLRIAPGRIDTTIDSNERKLTLQIRPDLRISFRVDSEFPNINNLRYRRQGLGAGAVDVTLPQRLVRASARVRRGNPGRDIDYVVVRRDIIDYAVRYNAYFKSGPPPRFVGLEKNGSLRSS